MDTPKLFPRKNVLSVDSCAFFCAVPLTADFYLLIWFCIVNKIVWPGNALHCFIVSLRIYGGDAGGTPTLNAGNVHWSKTKCMYNTQTTSLKLTHAYFQILRENHVSCFSSLTLILWYSIWEKLKITSCKRYFIWSKVKGKVFYMFDACLKFMPARCTFQTTYAHIHTKQIAFWRFRAWYNVIWWRFECHENLHEKKTRVRTTNLYRKTTSNVYSQWKKSNIKRKQKKPLISFVKL